MLRRSLHASAVALTVSLLTASAALAKGAPSKVTITGPGLRGEVEITDPALLQAFSFSQFENLNQKIEAPHVAPGVAYVVTRYAQDEESLAPWDRVIYYSGPQGELAAVFLEGPIGPNSSELDGGWYQASPAGDATMRRVLAEHLPTMPARAYSCEALWRGSPIRVFGLGVALPPILFGAALGVRRVLGRG